jgi:hypothetical protein
LGSRWRLQPALSAPTPKAHGSAGDTYSLKWATPWCPRNGVLVGCGIINEPLTVDEPHLKLGAHVIGNRLNGRADNKRVSFQDRIPNGRKVRAATRSCGAPDQQIVWGFNHRIIPFPPFRNDYSSSVPDRSLNRGSPAPPLHGGRGRGKISRNTVPQRMPRQNMVLPRIGSKAIASRRRSITSAARTISVRGTVRRSL